jgi:hypothetical protein
LFKKDKIFYKEVNYKFLYNNTLSYILSRRLNKLNVDLCKINMLFWYKHIPTEEFNLYRLYNNIMLIWLLFKQRSVIKNIGSSFRLNVYYSRATILTTLNKKNYFKFFDIYINSFIPSIRAISIKFFFVNENLVVNISDLSFFTSIKVGRFFYIENVTDDFLFEFKHKTVKIKNYLTIFKFNIK